MYLQNCFLFSEESIQTMNDLCLWFKLKIKLSNSYFGRSTWSFDSGFAIWHNISCKRQEFPLIHFTLEIFSKIPKFPVWKKKKKKSNLTYTVWKLQIFTSVPRLFVKNSAKIRSLCKVAKVIISQNISFFHTTLCLLLEKYFVNLIYNLFSMTNCFHEIFF